LRVAAMSISQRMPEPSAVRAAFVRATVSGVAPVDRDADPVARDLLYQFLTPERFVGRLSNSLRTPPRLVP
jgi:hypothetical protein